jgi:hypothetical protein
MTKLQKALIVLILLSSLSTLYFLFIYTPKNRFYIPNGKKYCGSIDLKIRTLVPSDWTCTTDTLQPGFGNLTLSNSLINISIDNTGREYGCNMESDCTQEPYYSSPLIDLLALKKDNKNKYIFGVFKDSTEEKQYGGMMITYSDIENKSLTDTEKNQLNQVLNALERTE